MFDDIHFARTADDLASQGKLINVPLEFDKS